MSSEDIKSIGRQLRQIEDPRTQALLRTILENIDEAKRSINRLENPIGLSWRDLVLQNGWVKHSDILFAPPQFTKTKENIVLLRGLISSGTITTGTVLFNVPEGYRPEYTVLCDLQTSTGIGRIDIDPSGNGIVATVSSAWTAFDGIFYLAQQ